MYCPKCGAEYQAGFTRCADCDVGLVDEAPVKHQRGPRAPREVAPELVVVGKYATEFEAHLAEGALRASGIQTTTRSDDAGGQYPGLAFSRGVELLVRAEDIAVARDILGAGQ
jgi:hypothetical protein